MHFPDSLISINSPRATPPRIPDPPEDPKRALGSLIPTPRRTGGKADTIEARHREIELSTRSRARERDRRMHAPRPLRPTLSRRIFPVARPSAAIDAYNIPGESLRDGALSAGDAAAPGAC